MSAPAYHDLYTISITCKLCASWTIYLWIKKRQLSEGELISQKKNFCSSLPFFHFLGLTLFRFLSLFCEPFCLLYTHRMPCWVDIFCVDFFWFSPQYVYLVFSSLLFNESAHFVRVHFLSRFFFAVLKTGVPVSVSRRLSGDVFVCTFNFSF